MTDERLDVWRNWCDGQIKENMVTMHAHRQVWETMRQTIGANPNVPESYWWRFLVDTYAPTQAMAVRRQADTRSDVVCLRRLIDEITCHPQLITRDYWIGLWDVEDERVLEWAHECWARQYAGTVGDRLDPDIPKQDLTRLATAAKAVKHWVDKYVAHTDAMAPAGPAITLTVDDIDEAVTAVGDLFRRYHNLLTANEWLEPTLPPNWTAVFGVPWAFSPKSG